MKFHHQSLRKWILKSLTGEAKFNLATTFFFYSMHNIFFFSSSRDDLINNFFFIYLQKSKFERVLLEAVTWSQSVRVWRSSIKILFRILAFFFWITYLCKAHDFPALIMVVNFWFLFLIRIVLKYLSDEATVSILKIFN